MIHSFKSVCNLTFLFILPLVQCVILIILGLLSVLSCVSLLLLLWHLHFPRELVKVKVILPYLILYTTQPVFTIGHEGWYLNVWLLTFNCTWMFLFDMKPGGELAFPHQGPLSGQCSKLWLQHLATRRHIFFSQAEGKPGCNDYFVIYIRYK